MKKAQMLVFQYNNQNFLFEFQLEYFNCVTITYVIVLILIIIVLNTFSRQIQDG